MSWNGYLELGGVPLINVEATETYVEHLAPELALRRIYDTDKVHIANQEAPYRTPVLDEAPWVNRLDESTHGFLGLYPVSVEGLDDSTLSAEITEYLGEGGSVGSQRDGTRSIRVTGLLVGRSLLNAHAGLDWLKAALRGGGCTDCAEGVLRWFRVEPDVCESGVFGPENGTDSISFGNLEAGVYRYRWDSSRVDPTLPMRARWEAQWAEGTKIRYGLAPLQGTTSLQQSGAVRPLRRNYAPNPTFRADLTGWVTSGSGTASWLPDPGTGDRGYANLVAVQGAGGSSSLYGSGAYGAGAYGQGTGGGTYGSGTYGQGLYGRGAVSAGASFSITGTTPAAVPAGAFALGLQLRSITGAPAQVSVLSASGATLAAAVLPTGTSWGRVVLKGVNPSASALQIVLNTQDALDADQVVLELGSDSDGYFDGTTAAAGFTATWEGASDQAVSRLVWTGTAEMVYASSAVRPVLEVIEGVALGAQLTWATRALIGMDQQLLPYERAMFDVACSEGVKVLQEIDAGVNGGYLRVEFVLTAGQPAAYTLPVAVDTTPLASGSYTDPDLTVTVEDLAWLSDPNSTVITRPPSAPVILNPAIETITTWRRYYVPIPAAAVADWGEAVPTVTLTSKGAPITQVRVRFHANPFGYAPQKVDPLAYCSEFILSYLPARTRLEVDGVLQEATASRGDRATASADHLLYGTGGGPVSWPSLSCAIPYVMTVDVPPGGTLDQLALEVELRKKV